jgi:hypothetical protein
MAYKIILTVVFFALVILLFWLHWSSMSAVRSADKSINKAARLAIRELLDAYANDADRKLTAAQAALFTDDAIIEVYMAESNKDSKPVQVIVW